MRADEFLRRHAPPPELMRSNHDNVNDHEAARLAARFAPEPTAAIDAAPVSLSGEQAGAALFGGVAQR